MDNYNIKVEHKESEYDKDYIITIKVNINEDLIAKFSFDASMLEKLPESYNQDWQIDLCLESADAFCIKNKNSIVSFGNCLCFTTTEIRLKYTPAIDDMLNKLKEICALV